MLDWALGFFLVAMLAALFGFGVIASSSAGIAKILFFIFVVLFVLSVVLGLVGKGRLWGRSGDETTPTVTDRDTV